MISSVIFNTGNACLALKQHDEALRAFEDCLRIRQKLMATHSYTGHTCHKIGVFVRGRGDLQSAAYVTPRPLNIFHCPSIPLLTLHRTFLRSALAILQPTEAHIGAKLRTAYALSDVLDDLGEFDEAARLTAEVERQLPELDSDLRGAVVDAKFFDRFVLYCHR
jgi:tetratricopeptide (TPR) repeat protein